MPRTDGFAREAVPGRPSGRTLLPMRSIGTVLLLVTLVACGGESDKPGADVTEPATESINYDAWRVDLAAAGEVRSEPDMETLEELTRSDCAAEVDDLALQLSLAGARADLMRINMRYVCPAEAGKVDEALEELQSSVSRYEDACATPKNRRTEDQQMMIDAVGPC